MKQILKDGTRRFRNFKYVSEKVKLNEFFYEGAIRGIHQELGILLDLKDLKYKRASIENKISGSYPNLLCKYQFFDYVWEMPVEYFKSDGYIADEEGTQTFFEWQAE